MNIGALLKQGGDLLEYRKSAALDCEVILAYVLGVDRAYLLAHNNEEVEVNLSDLFNVYLGRLKKGEPVAYIVQEKEFFGLNFFVDKRVLVPRPETEQLVEIVVNYLNRENREGRTFKVLDVGTGSGNIAVSIARYYEEAGIHLLDEVVAVDIEEGAVEVAKMNAAAHGVDHKINIFQSDLLDIVEVKERYDVIVANLPYIGEVKNRFISADVEEHEPRAALFGGYDGLELYNKMFQQILDKQISYDIIIGEFGFAQRKGMEDLLNKYFDQKWNIERDHAGIDRLFVVKDQNY